jgi:hypothetical protein
MKMRYNMINGHRTGIEQRKAKNSRDPGIKILQSATAAV